LKLKASQGSESQQCRMNSNDIRIKQAPADIDLFNSQDPRFIEVGGENMPYELAYSLRMTEMLHLYAPDASLHLQIAARGQHMGRWNIPRNSFPMDRAGYLKWRTKLKVYHADALADILTKNGFDEEDIEQVRSIIIKKGLKADAQAATLEDVVCLVFLKYYLEEFAAKHEEEKVVDILRKTWSKMTPGCHQWALSMNFSPSAAVLIKKALDPIL